jgi:hypothetical protein
MFTSSPYRSSVRLVAISINLGPRHVVSIKTQLDRFHKAVSIAHQTPRPKALLDPDKGDPPAIFDFIPLDTPHVDLTVFPKKFFNVGGLAIECRTFSDSVDCLECCLKGANMNKLARHVEIPSKPNKVAAVIYCPRNPPEIIAFSELAQQFVVEYCLGHRSLLCI